MREADLKGWLGPLGRVVHTCVLSPLGRQDLGMFFSNLSKEDLTALSDLMKAGTVTPVIDRRYDFVVTLIPL